MTRTMLTLTQTGFKDLDTDSPISSSHHVMVLAAACIALSTLMVGQSVMGFGKCVWPSITGVSRSRRVRCQGRVPSSIHTYRCPGRCRFSPLVQHGTMEQFSCTHIRLSYYRSSRYWTYQHIGGRFHIERCKSTTTALKQETSNEGTDTFTKATSLRLVAETEDDMEEIAYLVSSVSLGRSLAESPVTVVQTASPLQQPSLAQHTPSGLVIFLQGDLGAGKTTFARAFLRAATGDWSLRVTSPTYLLSNTYRSSPDTDGWTNVEYAHLPLA
jgi:Threonylcarbamoyl adenosine biosynthesis protein TsaE